MRISLVPGDDSDKSLVEKVAPPDWVNPVPAGRYNLIVIGGGTAGLVAAAGAAGLGARVALIERDLMGGDCLNAGCVPSKALLASAHAAARIQRSSALGVRSSTAEIDFAVIMQRLRRIRADLAAADSAERFRNLGVDVFFGSGRFLGPNTIAVLDTPLRFSRAVIATGTRPYLPEIPGLSDLGVYTNESIFTITQLPSRLAILGGGPIGCELAQAFARLGSRVTLLQRNSRLLPRDDGEAVAVVEHALARDGVEIVTNAEVISAALRNRERLLQVQSPAGRREVVVDAVLIAAGRTPNVESLDLERAGVDFDPRLGVRVNDRLCTTNRRIFAAGDICSRYQFTHAADAMARIVVQNALFLGRARVSRLIIPWCTYTDPEVAQVGLNESQARAQHIPFRVFRHPLSHVDRAVLEGEGEGFVKILTPPGSDRILGATVVASRAGELIGELSLAMRHGVGLRGLATTIYPYPTQSEVLRKLGDAYNRTRLTPWVKRLFSDWLRLWR